MDTLEKIKNHPVMVQVLADSYGGIIYNVANEDKYDSTELLELWETLDGGEKDFAGGIIGGAISFLKKEN